MTKSEIRPGRGVGGAGTEGPRDGRAGFSLVELVIALIILTVGILGLAGTTAYVVRQTDQARVSRERAAAVQTAVERIRAAPFDSIDAGSSSLGNYGIQWSVTDQTMFSRTVEIVTTGPGTTSTGGGVPVIASAVVDTFSIQVMEP